MFDQLSGQFFALVWATLLLSVSFGLVLTLLAVTRCRSWRIHRVIWLAVLAVGVFALFPVLKPFEIAVLDPIAPVEEFETASAPQTPYETVPLSGKEEVRKIAEQTRTVPPSTMTVPNEAKAPAPIEVVTSVPETPTASTAIVSANATEQEQAKPFADRLVPALAVLWLAGIVFLPLRWIFRTVRFYRFLNEDIIPTEPNADWTRAWRELQREQGIKRPIPLSVAEHFGPALTWRSDGTTLIVPLEGWDRLSESERESIMRHELEHYRRNDIWKTIVVRLLALPHWFNPLAWSAAHRFEDAAEWACDEAALTRPSDDTGQAVSTFARALVSLHETSTFRPEITGPETALQHHIFGRDISRRVTRILTFNTLNKKESIMKKLLLLGVCALLVSMALVQVRLVAKDAETKTNEETQTEHGKPAIVPEPDVDSSAKKPGQEGKLDDLVWRILGIRYTPIPKEQWKDIAGENVAEYPYGGITVDEVQKESGFARKGIRPGDILVAINDWIVASRNDLRYTAKWWQEKSRNSENESIRVFVLRDGQVSFTDISMKEASLDGMKKEDIAAQTMPRVDPDYLRLLKQRVETAEAIASSVEALYKIGAPGGRAQTFHETQMKLAATEADLYQAMGDKEKYREALKRKFENAAQRFHALDVGFKASNGVTWNQVLEAKQDLAEAEYEWKQAEKQKDPTRQTPFGAGAPSKPETNAVFQKREMTFQGKTFDRWVEELKTELDPKMRAEAFRALTTFGANGKGKEAAEVIVSELQNYDYGNYDNSPMGLMKEAAIKAFANLPPFDPCIPVNDSIPVLLRCFKEGNTSQRSLAWTVFSRFRPENTKGIDPEILYDLLWNLEDDAEYSEKFGPRQALFQVFCATDPTGDRSLRFLKEAIKGDDEKRFSSFFATTLLYEKRKKDQTDPEPWSFRFGSIHLFVFTNEPHDQNIMGGGMAQVPDTKKKRTPFGDKLLKFLQEEGVNSDNETIRETSKKIVEILLSVDKDENRPERQLSQ